MEHNVERLGPEDAAIYFTILFALQKSWLLTRMYNESSDWQWGSRTFNHMLMWSLVIGSNPFEKFRNTDPDVLTSTIHSIRNTTWNLEHMYHFACTLSIGLVARWSWFQKPWWGRDFVFGQVEIVYLTYTSTLMIEVRRYSIVKRKFTKAKTMGLTRSF